MDQIHHARPRFIRRIFRLAAIATVLCGVGLSPLGAIKAAASIREPVAGSAATSDPIIGQWGVAYGNNAVVQMSLSGSTYDVTAVTPVVLGSNGVPASSCHLPPGTLLASFSGSPPAYSGQHGLWQTSDCSFGVWSSGTFTLSSDGNTLVFASNGVPFYFQTKFTKLSPITISSVSTVTNVQTQTILISGSGFGTHAPFNGDLPCIEVSDLTAGWSAGHGDPAYAPGTDTGASCDTAQSPAVDLVTIGVSSWTDTSITITGFAGLYGSPYILTPGDQVRFRVWNAQTGAGPAAFTATVQALTGRPPSTPGAVKVSLANGAATVTWKSSSNPGSFPIDYYVVTAAPLANDRVPAPPASSVTTVVPSTTTSVTLTGLVADCHQTYTFSVTAHNAAGSSAPGVAGGGPYRPSGIVQQNGDPPLVVLLIDGKGVSGSTSVAGSGASFNPLQPTLNGPSSYCPEAPWDGVSSQAPTNFAPALQSFLGEGNSIGWNWTLPPIDFTNQTTTYTHAYMLDPLAAAGAVVLPYGYPSSPASFVRLKNGQPSFTFPGYTTDDNSDPYAEAATLASEVQQVHTVWPSSRIIIIGHSHGGLIAYLYWGGSGFGPGVRSSGVTRIFSLDSPINGTRACGGFGVVVCNSVTGNLYSTLWDSQADLDHVAIANDGDQSYIPIGSVGDSAFDHADAPDNGILSQILFNCSGIIQTCVPAYPPDVNSPNCEITSQTNPVVAGASHFAVRICPDYIATIARDAGVPVP